MVHGKIVILETSPWCQKYWGPLNRMVMYALLYLPLNFASRNPMKKNMRKYLSPYIYNYIVG